MDRLSYQTERALTGIFRAEGVRALEEAERRLDVIAKEYADAQRALREAAVNFSGYVGLDVESELERAARAFARAREKLLDAATELAVTWQVSAHDVV